MDAPSWYMDFLPAVIVTVLLSIISYFFFFQRRKEEEELEVGDLREIRARRLEQREYHQQESSASLVKDLIKEHQSSAGHSTKPNVVRKRKDHTAASSKGASKELLDDKHFPGSQPTIQDSTLSKPVDTATESSKNPAKLPLRGGTNHEESSTAPGRADKKQPQILEHSTLSGRLEELGDGTTGAHGRDHHSTNETAVSEPILGLDSNNAEESCNELRFTSDSMPTNNKRKKVQPPAIEELCQALSEAFSVFVQPSESPGSEWNGTEGWVKAERCVVSPSKRLELPFASLQQHYGTTTKDDPWDRLYMSLEAMRKAEPNIIVPDNALSMQWITSAYGRLRTSSQPEMARCLKLVQSWICMLGANALEVEMMSHQHDQQNDDMIPELFADEIVESNGNESGLLEQLVALLQNLSISIPCLDAIFENAANSEALVDLVLRQLMKQLDPEAFAGMSVLDTLSRSLQRINAVGHFMQSKMVQKHVAAVFTQELEGTGREVEKSFPMKQLFRLAAYTVPETVQGLERESFLSRHFEEALSSESSVCAEVAVFGRKGVKGFDQFQRQSRQLIESARFVCRIILEKSMRASKGANKGKVFHWLMQIAELNHPLTTMLAADLLSPDGIVAISSSWPFLNGIASSLISICVNRLKDEFDKKKLSAFDHRFLLWKGFRAICSESNGMSRQSKSSETFCDTPAFDGITKFFFTISSVLHASLYPMMRVEGSFRTRYNKALIQLQNMAAAPETSVGFESDSVSKVAVRGWIGWATFLDDPSFVGDMVNFTLLQLQWILELVQAKSGPGLADVPDWMCKEPARWLSHVAAGRSLFIPHQAELTIEIATRLLAAGSVSDGRSQSNDAQFSPVVLAELIHIVSAFVRSGVRKAKKRNSSSDGTSGVDDRSLYLSLDKGNLSTYVYTNALVAKQLCPVLMTTFQVLDHVEGLNVDAENSFDKYSVKSEISRLLLILWGHPYDDRCRKSMISMPDVDLSKFIASVALVVGTLFDDGHQRFVDVCKAMKKGRLTHQERAFMERQKDRATNAFAASRGFLLLLWKLCLDPRMASIMGRTSEAAKDLSAMITTIIELTVHSDGGLLDEIDTVSLPQRSSKVLLGVEKGEFEPTAVREMISTLVLHRRSVKKEYGLDVSLLVCILLSIAARSTEACQSAQISSTLAESFAGQDDCDVARLRTLVCRYFPGGPKMNSVEEDVLRQDGNVGDDVWLPEAPTNEAMTSAAEKHRQGNAAKDHISLEEIQRYVRRESVVEFIDAVEVAKKKHDLESGLGVIDPKSALEQLLSSMVHSQDKDYTEHLREWVVSSHSLSMKVSEDICFSHAFDHATKAHTTTAPGKGLVKEARKCHKNIPAPHPNSAVFVCFAEERMDICRCLITGPVDTPYAYGAFEFDVFFPSSYPNIPPLLQFITTGGGRVRFGPNLYLDGKVCLSLLGTFNAQDQSQQWNPKESSLPQVLLSIQTQLLTEDPYFNEPGHEAIRHTNAGKEASRSYNLKRSLDTLRYAIIEPLTNPTVGFEEITYRHFALCRQQIVAQARRWVLEAKGTDLEKRFAAVFDRLVVALHGLPEEIKAKYPPLLPRQEDIRVLRRNLDPLFSHLYKTRATPGSPSASPQLPVTGFVNPWAANNLQFQANPREGSGGGDADIEDFYS